jgi:hypothetical protein
LACGCWSQTCRWRTLDEAYRTAHRELWPLFVGLWAPTFLILAQIFEARARDARDTRARLAM